MTSDGPELIDETRDALQRVQDFDTQKLIREAELGKKFAMRDAVAPAKRVIELFKLIGPNQLEFFPDTQLETIRDQANAFYSLLEEIENFDVEEASPNPSDAKDALVQRLDEQFQPVFNILFPLVSFSNIRSLDFAKLEREARAATQAAKDSVAAALVDIEDGKKSVETLVGETRALAAEQGVSKQAIHFKTEADKHAADAVIWRSYTVRTAIGLGIFSFLSLFAHNLPGLESTDAYRAAQIGISKVLIFGVIAFMLVLCARNFLSHRHNEVVNRHRQNALATFTALAEATSDAASSDIVLSHAAACIFSPQDTGYVKSAHSATEGVPALQIIPRVGNIAGGGAQ